MESEISKEISELTEKNILEEFLSTFARDEMEEMECYLLGEFRPLFRRWNEATPRHL